MVMRTRITQYWKTPTQTIYTAISTRGLRICSYPSHIEPCQAAARGAPNALTTATFLHPVQRPKPLFRLDPAEIILLTMQIRCDIVTHEGEEGGDTEGFVTVTEDLEVDGIVVEENAEPGDEGIDGDHEQDANDTRSDEPC